MKRTTKITVLLLLLTFVIAGTSCSHRTCKGMKYYNQDKKRGLAH